MCKLCVKLQIYKYSNNTPDNVIDVLMKIVYKDFCLLCLSYYYSNYYTISREINQHNKF